MPSSRVGLHERAGGVSFVDVAGMAVRVGSTETCEADAHALLVTINVQMIRKRAKFLCRGNA